MLLAISLHQTRLTPACPGSNWSQDLHELSGCSACALLACRTPLSWSAAAAAHRHGEMVQVLFCRLLKDQRELYRAYISSQEVDDILEV